MSVLNFLLKNLQGCCLLFNYQSSFLLPSQRQLIYIITFAIACQQLFYFSFSLSVPFISVVRNSLSRISFLSTFVNKKFLLFSFFFQSLFTLLEVTWSCFSSNLIFKDCFLLPYTWALKHFPVSSHATACLIYHARPELSILFLLFILFAQFTQFIFPSGSNTSLFSQIRRGNQKRAPLPVNWDIALLSVNYTLYYTLYLL